MIILEKREYFLVKEIFLSQRNIFVLKKNDLCFEKKKHKIKQL